MSLECVNESDAVGDWGGGGVVKQGGGIQASILTMGFPKTNQFLGGRFRSISQWLEKKPELESLGSQDSVLVGSGIRFWRGSVFPQVGFYPETERRFLQTLHDCIVSPQPLRYVIVSLTTWVYLDPQNSLKNGFDPQNYGVISYFYG